MVIGLTGGIGTGKSTVTGILTQFGAFVVDADRVGHAVYEPGREGWERVVAEFGREIIASDGTIDRRKLGTVVFGEPQRLARLNELIHPLMGAEIQRRIQAQRARDRSRPIVLEAAVMIEARWHAFVDELWVVVASRDAVLRRIASERGLDRAAIEARISSQLSDEERCRYADVVIENSGDRDDLKRRLEALWRQRVGSPSGE